MGCIFKDLEGKCSLAMDTLGNYEENSDIEGCDIEGCSVDSDPCPLDSCSNYESDYTCYECGADLNIEECTCEEN